MHEKRQMLDAGIDDLNACEMVPCAEVGREIAKYSFIQRSIFENFNFKDWKIDVFFTL